MRLQRNPAALLILCLLSWPVLAQTSLKLPHSDDDYRALIGGASHGSCEHCGVVQGIRTQTHTGPRVSSPAPVIAPSLVSTPLLGTGSAVEDARHRNDPVVVYVITVRYDDGSFAFVEQHDEPLVRKGDRVQVVEGRVEPRTE